MEKKHPQRNALAMAFVLLITQLHAQTVPDAGQILQQLKPPTVPPRENELRNIQTSVPSSLVLPGGPKVMLQAIHFVGNSVISEDTLQATLGNVTGKSFDLAGLRGLTTLIADLYHASGFPFARAVLPPQDLQYGVLYIKIIEGRYGLVQVQAEKIEDAAQAAPFLSNLMSGAVIETAALERASLLLNDLPGIKSAQVISPGAQVGTGDLTVQVSRDKRITGDVRLDNSGSRYTGQTRALANFNINSPFILGDQISISTLASDERLFQGSLSYSTPLGSSGLRGNVGYSYTSYVLAKEFASLYANGVAKATSVGLSYPLVRSQKRNLTLSGTYQVSYVQDNIDSTNTRTGKSSVSVPIALQFDNRDSAGGGGITSGSVGWTLGNLKLDAALDTYNTLGRFNKFNLDLMRLQPLPEGFSLMGRISLQGASKNLDSSEKMSLGGPGGVRAYPTGELSGDEGVLAQLELRYNAGIYEPYVFWDVGTIKDNAKPSSTATNNKRSLSGGGVGVRFQRNAWSGDIALAWRGTGGAPQSDTSSDPSSRVWAHLEYKF